MKNPINSAMVLMLALFTASAFAAGGKFSEVDQDNNQSISKVEFERHIGDRYYSKMDRNGDGVLDESEFSSHRVGALSEFDRDGDSRLTQAEFYNGLFEKYDTNRDMTLDKNEWKQVESAGIGR